MTVHIKTIYETFFDFSIFSGTTELFIGYSLLQLSLYSIVLHNLRIDKTKFNIVLLSDFYIAGAFIFSLAALLLLNEDVYQHKGLLTSFNVMLLNDYFSFITKEIICISVAIFFLSLKFIRSDVSLSNSFEYLSFIIASALGSILLCSSNDFVTAYLALELQSISFYLMACSKKNSSYSIESGLKYFVIGSFSSAFFLLGSSFLYINCGTLNFSELKVILSLFFLAKTDINFGLMQLGFILIGLSLLIKLAVAPFHLWSIDVYESSPAPTTYFFAVIPKLGLFVLLVRIFYSSGFLIFMSDFAKYCSMFALISIAVGALGGLEQRKLKSLFAYSSIGHTGYALLAFSSGNDYSVTLTIYYLIFYMLSSLCFWFTLMFLKQKSSNFSQKLNKELGDLVLLRKSNLTLSIILGITTFSLAGIPPIIGFLIKFGVFLTAIQSSIYLVSTIGILLSVMSTFYYLRLIKIIFFENSLVGKLYHPVNNSNSFLISISSIMLLVLFFKPSLLYLLIFKSYLIIF